MQISLPASVPASKGSLFVVKIEVPAASHGECIVEVAAEGPLQPLDLQGVGPGGRYGLPQGVEALHVPIRVDTGQPGTAVVHFRVTDHTGAQETQQHPVKLDVASQPVKGGSKAGLVALLLIGMAGIGIWLGPKFLQRDFVPDVRGVSFDEAQQRLAEAGYRAKEWPDIVQDAAKHGVVLRTKPKGGEPHDKQEEVAVFVGELRVEVMHLVGQTEAAAERSLQEDGLAAYLVFEDVNDEKLFGKVLSQSARAGDQVPLGTSIELVIGRDRWSAPGPVEPPIPPTPGPDEPMPEPPTPVPPTPAPGPDEPKPEPPTPAPGPDEPKPEPPTPAPGPDEPKPEPPTPAPGPDEPKPEPPMPGPPGPDEPKPEPPTPAPGPDEPKPEPPPPVPPTPAPGPDEPKPEPPMPGPPGPDEPKPEPPTPAPGPDEPKPEPPTPAPGPDEPKPEPPTPEPPTPAPGPDEPKPEPPTPEPPTPAPGPDEPKPEPPTPEPPTPAPGPDEPKPEPPTPGPDEPKPEPPVPAPGPDEPKPEPPVPAPGPDEPKPEPPTPEPPTPEPPTPEPPTPEPPTPGPDEPKPEPPTPVPPAPTPGPNPGGDEIIVPDVIGMTRDLAQTAIRRAGLRYRTKLEVTEDAPDGQVLTQSPSAGDVIGKRTRITIIVARRPTAKSVVTVRVPDVTGLVRKDAEKVLREAGFLVRLSYEPREEALRGLVCRQSPDSGTVAKPRSWVEIVVGIGR